MSISNQEKYCELCKGKPISSRQCFMVYLYSCFGWFEDKTRSIYMCAHRIYNRITWYKIYCIPKIIKAIYTKKRVDRPNNCARLRMNIGSLSDHSLGISIIYQSDLFHTTNLSVFICTRGRLNIWKTYVGVGIYFVESLTKFKTFAQPIYMLCTFINSTTAQHTNSLPTANTYMHNKHCIYYTNKF